MKKKVIILLIFLVITLISIKYFEKYDETYTGPYYAKHSSVESGNYNIGLLFQYDALISWQIGYDSAVPGIHFGIGFTIN